MATHDLDLVTELCSRVVLLEEGKINLDCQTANIANEDLLRQLGAID